MSDMDTHLKYVFEMIDNVSATASGIEQSTSKASEKIKQTTIDQQGLETATDRTTQSFTRQEAQFVKQVAVLMTVKESVSAVTSGLITLGIVSGDNAAALQKLNAGFQILVGFASGIKALQAVSEALKTSELGLAVVETFRSVMQSPWKAALVGVGVGAAGGLLAATMAGGSRTTTNSSTQIVIENTASNVDTATGINATISGGRII
ncbi:MAG: hypothetical protein RBR71_13045 [Gudongella sp.]|nr:hypothetical protein [Gudongella sp.]